MAHRAHLERTYLSVDPRSAGLFRVALSLVLLLDLIDRVLHPACLDPALRAFPFLPSGIPAALAGTSFSALALGALLCGYRTTLAQLAALGCALGASGRLGAPERAGDALLHHLLLLGLFLPLGRRFSFDALLHSLRSRPERSAAELADRTQLRGEEHEARSPAALALLLLLCLAALSVLVATTVLHGLGRAHLVFALATLALACLFVREGHWAALERVRLVRGPRLRCFFDADCGICFQTVRVLARLDPGGRIELIPNHERDRLPAGVDAELTAGTVVVEDVRTGRVTTRSHAVAAVCRALPFGFPAYALLELPPLRPLFLALYDLVSRNRAAISQWLGLAACGIPQPQTHTAGSALKSPPQPPVLASVRRVALGLVLALELCAALDASPWGGAVPPLRALIDRAGLSWALPVMLSAAPNAADAARPNCRSDSGSARDRVQDNARDRSR